MIVQKGGLHFAVHHNAQKSQDDRLKNHNSTVSYTCVCVFRHVEVCFCDTTVTSDTVVSKKPTYKTVNLIPLGEPSNLYKLSTYECLIVRSFKWTKGAGLWYTICPKCLCKGYTSGLSHSMLHDCSLHLRFHFALWYRKPCIDACSSAASLQWPHWGRDPERMHGARTETRHK